MNEWITEENKYVNLKIVLSFQKQEKYEFI